MRQLFINGNPSQHFFREEITLEQLAKMLNTPLDGMDFLELNEAFSCTADFEFDMIVIRGDEDLMELTLEIIKPML